MANKKGAIPKLRAERAFARSPKTVRTPPKENASTPISQPSKSANVSMYMCEICSIVDDLEKIRCDECKLWFHYDCGNIPREAAQQDTWICAACTAKKARPPVTMGNLVNIGEENLRTPPVTVRVRPPLENVLESNMDSSAPYAVSNAGNVSAENQLDQPAMQVPMPAVNETSSTKGARSHKSSSARSNVSRRASLALQRLEEERSLMEQRDNEARLLQAKRDLDYIRQKYLILEDDNMSNLSFDDQEVEQGKFEFVQHWANSIPNISSVDNASEDGAVGGDDVNVTAIDMGRGNWKKSNARYDFPDPPVSATNQNGMTMPSNNANKSGQISSQSQPPGAMYTASGQPPSIGVAQTKLVSAIPSASITRAQQQSVTTLGANQIPFVAASQSQQLGASQTPFVAASQSQQLGASQMPFVATSQSHPLGVSQMPFVAASQSQQLGASQTPFITASQSHPLGVSQMPFVAASQSQQLGASQTPFITASQSHPSGVSQMPFVAASQSQQLGASQTPFVAASQSHPLGASQMPFVAASQSHPLGVSQIPFVAASQSQQLGASQMPFVPASQFQPLGVSQMPFVAASQMSFVAVSQSQPLGASQMPLITTSQTRTLSANQTQFMAAGQPHLFGANHAQMLNAHQNSLINQSAYFGQANNASQPFVSGRPVINTSSIQPPPPMTYNTSYIPSGQSFNTNQNVYTADMNGTMMGTGQSNALPLPNAMNVSSSTRLTSEQIAARHVEKELPIFNGDPRYWGSFISAYDNANLSCGYTTGDNMSRLKKCLKGDAMESVRSLLLHKDTVPQAIETLRLLYGMPEHVVQATIKDVREITRPKEDDLRSLIKFAMAVQNLSATIQSTGAVEHLRNPDLMNSIVEKLPSQHQLNWAFYKSTIADVNIRHLGDWLFKIAAVASQVVQVVQSKPTKANETSGNEKKRTNQSKSNLFINSQVELNAANEAIEKSNNVPKSDKKGICPACSNNKCTKLEKCKKFKEATRNERWTIVRNANLCGRCFGLHKYYRCPSDQKCAITGCNMNHHTLLHKANSDNKSSATPNVSTDADKKKDSSTCNSQRSVSHLRIDKFRIVPVMLYNGTKVVQDYAYLDDGSNTTTMEESLADELDLKGPTEELCVDWAFGKTHSVESRKVTAKISGYFENAPRFKMSNIRTVKNLHLPTQSITASWLEQYPHFKNVPITTYQNAKPRILIGLQYSSIITSRQTIEGKEDEPLVCRTRLGWVVQGPTYEGDGAEVKKFRINTCVCHTHDNELHKLVKDYFKIEHLGIKIPENNLESNETRRAREILEATTIKKGDRYEAGLLWKHDKIELPESYNMALKRLVCLEAKMEKDPVIKANLHGQIKQFVEKGYIRKLSSEELKNCKHPVWYLPTFPVFNPKKPEKVRLVWDGKARVNGTSLNANLLVGPDELVPLPELLRRFRERKIGVIADVAEMYHQVQVRESDQHVQRFLWRDDPSKEPEVYIMMVMTFGSKCSPSTAQYVKNKNAKEFEAEFPRAVEAIIRNHYVDDLIDCADTVDEAEKLVNDVKMIHRAGGFHIRNFASNSKLLMERIGEDVVTQSKNWDIGIQERVLGMFWNMATDTFTYSLKFTKIDQKMVSGKYCPTKREVLRMLMSVFDPLGLIAKYLVYGKILLQEIWKSKIEWDEKIPKELQAKWLNWICTLPQVEKLQIPRWYSIKLTQNAPVSIQLHTFVDASIEACAAATYLRIEDAEGVDCCLVSAKTKVAPTKELTVPRLELQAAVIGTRLAENIKQSQTVTIDKHIFWTDSQTVMAWINSESRRYNQFVSFRIGEILEATDPIQWRWVPTKHNVADEATKSKVIPTLDANSRWFKAPQFLYEDDQCWSGENENFTTKEELRPRFVMSIREIHRERLIDLARFSQWNRLIRVQAYVLRFTYNITSIKQKRLVGTLSQEELIRAERQLFQRAQRDAFLDEILVIKHNEKATKLKEFEKSSELRTLSPYLDEHNVLRMKGRIDAAESIPQDMKRPIILPRRHRITKLLVDWYHRKYKHINHRTALNEIRQRFVIPALRVVMKGVRNSCQICKNASAKPRVPEMAELPPARLAISARPFTFTGVDYFGPFPVKVNRSVVPKYGVLFTCLTTRAIHLEVADSLNTESCIEAIIRFSARKGMPREFYSDNGTNFHGADNELKREFEKLDKNVIEERFTSTEQKWTFIAPTASHMGGAWERLIQTVKSCITKMLTTKTPSYEMLCTLMAEVENIVNSRPLTYLSLDSVDDEALTPNHFLFGSSNAMKPIGETTPRDLNGKDWRAIQEMTKHFWRQFVLEYLPDLTKRTKWFKKVEPIKVGDVVLNIDERYPKNTWPKGIVEELITAGDGCIRQVMVRFEKNILRRPVSKLAILELTPPNDVEEDVKLNESLNGGKDVVQRSIADSTDTCQSGSGKVLPEKSMKWCPEEGKRQMNQSEPANK